MLEIEIKSREAWDASKDEFVQIKSQKLCLEHSLVSIAKWESVFKKPFLSDKEKTKQELLYYIKCMTLTQNVDPSVYGVIDDENLKKINDYVSDSMTATWFNERKPSEGAAPIKKNQEQITSELIYYWMISYQIPIECQKWHLNRLLTLIRIFNIKEGQASGKKGKMSKRDILAQNKAMNAARRQKLGTKG